jgi:hypothetical protein
LLLLLGCQRLSKVAPEREKILKMPSFLVLN